MRPGATFTNMIFFIDKIVCNQTMDNDNVYGCLERKFCISRVRKNSLITRETIICMYERDTIHDLSFNTNPDLKLRYRNLRNNVTFLIRKNKYSKGCGVCSPWSSGCLSRYDDIIKWKHFPRYWPFVRGIHRPPVNSPHKGQWRGALMFSLICV